MKKLISIFLVITMFLCLSTNVFAQDNSDNIYKIKDSYIINEDGTISKKDKSTDKYSKSLNFLIGIGSIEVDSNGRIIDYYNEEIYSPNLKRNIEVDYNALYQECINLFGKYYGIVPVEEINNIINYIDKSIPKDELSDISSLMLTFDYYNTVLTNTIILAYKFYSYVNIGYPQELASFETGLYFANQVRSGGNWDYKYLLGTQALYICDMENYVGVYSGEAIGNMHYGTVGSYLFTPSILKAAAGLYQIYSGTFQLSWFATYFDDPLDQYYIQVGIDLHSQYDFPTAPYIR